MHPRGVTTVLTADIENKGVAWNMQSNEGFIDQSPDALRLSVVEGDLDRAQFTCLEGGTFEQWGVCVDATVIGASHVVSFSTGSFLLNEVFACAGLNGIPSWTLSELIGLSVERQLPGMCYEFTARHIEWRDTEPPEVAVLSDAAMRSRRAGGIGVVQDFPAGSLPVTPKTILVGYASRERRGIVMETAHSYPTRGLILSRSELFYSPRRTA